MVARVDIRRTQKDRGIIRNQTAYRYAPYGGPPMIVRHGVRRNQALQPPRTPVTAKQWVAAALTSELDQGQARTGIRIGIGLEDLDLAREQDIAAHPTGIIIAAHEDESLRAGIS
jgi:hypothetical protein